MGNNTTAHCLDAYQSWPPAHGIRIAFTRQGDVGIREFSPTFAGFKFASLGLRCLRRKRLKKFPQDRIIKALWEPPGIRTLSSPRDSVQSGDPRFLGDADKFVSTGKQRLLALQTTGRLTTPVAFAAGESSMTLHGYSHPPHSQSHRDRRNGRDRYDAATQHFTVRRRLRARVKNTATVDRCSAS